MWKALVTSSCVIAALAAWAIFVGFAGPAENPESEQVRGTPWRGEPGITESVAQIMERQSRRQAAIKNEEEEPERSRPKRSRQPNPDSPRVSRWPSGALETVLSPAPLSFHSVGTSFKAVTLLEAPHDPPDTIGAVGPTQILVVVNARIRVFSRNGEIGPLDVSLNDFFASVNGGVTTWDPQVKYDRLSGRFFLTALNDGVPNHVLIAVSSGSVIESSTSFTFFRFRNDEPTPTGHPDSWADYDGLGVDRLSLYIGIDAGTVWSDPNGTIYGTDGFVVNKADLLNGVLTVTVFREMCPAHGGTGPDDPRGVSNDDPSATEGYFIGPDFKRFGRLILRRVTYPGGVPTISSNIFLTVPQTDLPLDVPHAGMAYQDPVDPEDDRLFTASIHTNKITGVRSLWTAHNIAVDASGVASGFLDRDGSRWYEIGSLSSTPVLIQSGTVFDPATWPYRYFFIPSIAMSGQGHATIGFTTSGDEFYLDAGAAGRLSGDTPGTMRPFNLLTSSQTTYNPYFRSLVMSWGDYSATVVDPNDDMTFWTFQEYCDETNSWGIRVVELKAPPPATPVSAAPDSLCSGIPSVQVAVSGNVVSGSGFFDPGPDTGGPGFANHIAASVTGGVSVTNVQFDSPTQVRLSLSTVGAAAGGQDISITNPDGQSVTGTGLLTIVPQPSTPAVSNSGPICVGGTLQLSASTIPGATYSWSGPNGFTSTAQNPTIPGASGAASGSYRLTVTVGGCSSAEAITSATILAGGAACNDGNACTLGETCQTGMCQGGVPRDTDLDAHSDAACGGNDCDDTNSLVWSVPGEVAGLVLSATSPADPTWDDQNSFAGPGTTYDLVSGLLGGITGIDLVSSTCLQSGGGTSYLDVRPEPAPGQGYWYLARARNSCGIGTYGSSQRDSLSVSCP